MSQYHCEFCLNTSNEPMFYRRHIGDQTVTVQFRSGLSVTVDRCNTTLVFRCPWDGCIHRDCNSAEFTQHILTCDHKPSDAE